MYNFILVHNRQFQLLNSNMKIIWRNNLISLWYQLFRSKSKIKLIRIGQVVKEFQVYYLFYPRKKFAQNASHFIKSVDNREDLDVFYLIHKKQLTYIQK